MRISDWSSDVCSSDLRSGTEVTFTPSLAVFTQIKFDYETLRNRLREAAFKVGESTVEIGAHYFAHVLGPREDRKSGAEGKSVSVRVDLGGPHIIKKQTQSKTKE